VRRITPEVLELFERVMQCEIDGVDDYDKREELYMALGAKPWDASPCFAFGDAPEWIAREPQLLERWQKAKEAYA
jgi:hypothetical protein